MFTGIIQDVGKVVSCSMIEAGGMALTLSTALDSDSWKLGDSVAVNGCCLTVVALHPCKRFSVQLSQETLNLTNLASLHVDEAVNLEPALRASDPMGGHVVSGHIDGIATLESRNPCGDFLEMRFSIDTGLAHYVVTKGSIALDGVSLTVNRVTDHGFSICLIPHTLEQTNLKRLQPGMQVNMETDILARYVERQLQYLTTAQVESQGENHASKL